MAENAEPDRMCFDKSDRELYNKLDSEAMLSHKRNSRKEQFLFAMAIGVKYGKRLPLDNKEGMFLAKDLHPADIAESVVVSRVEQSVAGSVFTMS